MAEMFFCRLDTSGLRSAVESAARFNKRTPSIGANTAAFFVMRGWVRSVTRVPVSKIDRELATTVYYEKTKTGRISTDKRRNRRFKGGISPIQQTKRVPLAVLIILARANRAGLTRGQGNGTRSNYNITTEGRYELPRVPPKELMAAYIHRMISTRHSASAFLASSGIPAIRALEDKIDPKYRRGAPPRDPRANAAFDRHSKTDKSVAFPASPGMESVFCHVEIMVGLDGGRNAVSRNQAMHRHGWPELQRQIDVEAENAFKKVAEWEARELLRRLRRSRVIA